MKEQLCSISGEVPTVNFHLWKPCNMGCDFCFATFPDIPSRPSADFLPEADALYLVSLLSQAGFRKINFAGGEPTLCPWLSALIRHAKSLGLTTSVVTNGSKVTDKWLDGIADSLDILALSIDSVDADALSRIGRFVNGKQPISEDEYLHIGESVKRRDIRLKVNTVVNRHNLGEDFRPFIRAIGPERWKIFQALPVAGQNDQYINALTVTQSEFEQYVNRNRSVELDGIKVVPENNESMTGSYLMVDPLGRFFDNTEGKHTYSKPILEVGVTLALEDIKIYPERFAERGGLYQ